MPYQHRSAKGPGHALAARWMSVFVLAIVAAPASAYDPAAGDFSKANLLDIRLVSYNVHRRFISDSSSDAAFQRVLRALAPDIIIFEEIDGDSIESQIPSRLDAILPYGAGAWNIHDGMPTVGIRTVIASRFPLTMKRIDTEPPSSTRGVTIALVDLPDAAYPVDVYLLGVHLKCCGDPGGSEDLLRQRSADAIAAWLGDARQSGGRITLGSATPMIVLGDFNLVGGPEPLNTLLTGDIFDEITFGPDVKGDWDVSNTTDLTPTDPFTQDPDTWPSDTTDPYSRLDRFIYTDSVVSSEVQFILNTLNMSAAQLASAGLQSFDTTELRTSDHLPAVMDLRLFVDCNSNGIADATDIAGGTSGDCNVNGAPDECDIASGASADGDADGVPDECQSGRDCDSNGVDDAVDLLTGAASDCNGNAVPDSCDIAGGTSHDCDGSGVPDECGEGDDCNGNGLLDACDLVAGTSEDCNDTGVPDECELGVRPVAFASGELSPFGVGFPKSFAFSGPPPTGDVVLSLTAFADFGNQVEYIDVSLNGVFLARVFQDAWQCTTTQRAITVPKAVYEAAVGTGGAVIQMAPSDFVNPDLCDPISYITVRAAYFTEGENDCNENRVPDGCDIDSGESDDCDADGRPDECQPDCDSNGVADVCDLAAGTSEDCDGGGVPDVCDIAAGTGADCNGNAVPDACDIATGQSADCDGDARPDECQLDCDSNGVADVCDLASGASLDCNGNQTPDECDLAGGTSADCDANGIPDECALAGGSLLRTLLAPTAGPGDSFAYAMAGLGTEVVIGAFGDDTGAAGAGAAHLFDVASGAWRLTIPNPDPRANDNFGFSVAALGGDILVGAYGKDLGAIDSGAVFRFDGATGELLWVYPNPAPAARDWFGIAVASAAGDVLVGARRDDTGATDTGIAYLLDAETGALLHTFENPTPQAFDNFGVSVAGVGDMVVIGANLDDTRGSNAGAAYAFSSTTGELLFSLFSPIPEAEAEFGIAVAAAGDDILVGEHRGHGGRGAAHLFDGQTGQWLRTFTSPAEAPGADQFGVAVAGDGALVLIGASIEDAGAVDAGAAYLFDANTGRLVQGIRNPFPQGGDLFGRSVALVGERVAVGAYWDDAAAADAGAAYVFGIITDCNTNGVIDICDIAGGTSTDCNVNAKPDECETVTLGDHSGNGVTDIGDYAALSDCLSGPDTITEPHDERCVEMCLKAFDTDGDEDIDLVDFAEFQKQFDTADRD